MEKGKVGKREEGRRKEGANKALLKVPFLGVANTQGLPLGFGFPCHPCRFWGVNILISVNYDFLTFYFANLATKNFNQNAHQEEKKREEGRRKEGANKALLKKRPTPKLCHLGLGFSARVERLEVPGVNIIRLLNFKLDFVTLFCKSRHAIPQPKCAPGREEKWGEIKEGRGKQSPFEGSVLGFLKCLGKNGKTQENHGPLSYSAMCASGRKKERRPENMKQCSPTSGASCHKRPNYIDMHSSISDIVAHSWLEQFLGPSHLGAG